MLNYKHVESWSRTAHLPGSPSGYGGGLENRCVRTREFKGNPHFVDSNKSLPRRHFLLFSHIPKM